MTNKKFKKALLLLKLSGMKLSRVLSQKEVDAHLSLVCEQRGEHKWGK